MFGDMHHASLRPAMQLPQITIKMKLKLLLLFGCYTLFSLSSMQQLGSLSIGTDPL
jgi:hypothetical protein